LRTADKKYRIILSVISGDSLVGQHIKMIRALETILLSVISGDSLVGQLGYSLTKRENNGLSVISGDSLVGQRSQPRAFQQLPPLFQ